MARRKAISKKSGKYCHKSELPQLSLPLENRRRIKPAVKTDPIQKTVRPRLKDRIIFVLNCGLSILLFFLLFVEVLNNKNDMPLRIDIEKISVAGTKKTEDSSLEQEDNFLKTALSRDEASDFNMFQLEYGLQANTSAVEVPADDLREKITHIDDLNLSNEEIYHLYEEKLPEDIVVHDKPDKKPPLPMIAIVIDDMGISASRTKDISSLRYPISASFLTYADNLKAQIANSVASGQEIMAHLPMEPQVMQNFTPTMLTTKMADKEILSALNKMLDTIPEAAAVNNHMGSRFTEDKHRMAVVMKELARRGISFLDSKTTPHSVGPEQARRFGVKLTMRNVFLDNKDDFNYISGQLRQTEEIARSKGYAVAIGHPKAQTYLALKAWLPTVQGKGLRLVHLSELSKHITP